MLMEILPYLGENFHVKRVTNISITVQWVGEQPFDFERFSRLNMPHFLLDVRNTGWITAWRLS